jgi:DNA-binding transcriptional MerR regulator
MADANNEGDRFLRPREVSEHIGVHIDSIRRWRREGVLSPESYIVIAPGAYRYKLRYVLRDLQARV